MVVIIIIIFFFCSYKRCATLSGWCGFSSVHNLACNSNKRVKCLSKEFIGVHFLYDPLRLHLIV